MNYKYKLLSCEVQITNVYNHCIVDIGPTQLNKLYWDLMVIGTGNFFRYVKIVWKAVVSLKQILCLNNKVFTGVYHVGG
jgi:hypothetical protein